MTVDEERRSASTQIFVAGDVLDIDGPIVLDSDTEHHLTRVLRLSEGERVSVSDGVGRCLGVDWERHSFRRGVFCIRATASGV